MGEFVKLRRSWRRRVARRVRLLGRELEAPPGPRRSANAPGAALTQRHRIRDIRAECARVSRRGGQSHGVRRADRAIELRNKAGFSRVPGYERNTDSGPLEWRLAPSSAALGPPRPADAAAAGAPPPPHPPRRHECRSGGCAEPHAPLMAHLHGSFGGPGARFRQTRTLVPL